MKITIGLLTVLCCACCLLGEGVRLSEITLKPTLDAGPMMVELQNTAKNEVDISGWTLWDSEEHCCEFPPETVLLPGETAVVVFGELEQNILSPESTGKVLVCDAPWAAEAFQDDCLEECALYSSRDRMGEYLEDYIQWGHRAYLMDKVISVSKHQALENGIFEDDVMIREAVASNKLKEAKQNFLRQKHLVQTIFSDGNVPGRSIGIILNRKLKYDHDFRSLSQPLLSWFVYLPEETSLGRENPLVVPRLRELMKEVRIFLNWQKESKFFALFNWDGHITEDGNYYVQISSSADFHELLHEYRGQERQFRLELPPGDYYWRIRTESGDEVGKWSEVFDLYIRDVSK